VVGLILVAIGAMRGMQRLILADLGYAATLLAIAFLGNAGMQILGALLFCGVDRQRALTVGLVSGNHRNNTLVWAAAALFVATHAEVGLFLAMSVFPIFILPLVTRRLLPVLDASPIPEARSSTDGRDTSRL
jgi:BASS family bile acid:Na+ symporter